MAPEIGIHRRQHRREESPAAQHLEAARALPGEEQLQRLIEQARRRHAGEELAQRPDGFRRGRLDLKAELRLEARGAEHPHRILAKARLRIADQPERPRLDVLGPADIVPEREVGDVVIERVDGEVSPPDVLVNRAVDVVSQDSSARIERDLRCGTGLRVAAPAGRALQRRPRLGRNRLGLEIRIVELRGLAILGVGLRQRLIALRGSAGGAKRRDLDDVASEEDMRQAESAAHQAAVAEQALHLLRERIGCDVEVLRLHPEQKVAHASAHEKRLESTLPQAVQHAQGVRRDVGAGNRVLGSRNDPGRSGWRRNGRVGRVHYLGFRLEQSGRASIIPRSSPKPPA